MTLANTSGSTVAADSIPPSFGHPFKQGDIPSGSYPQVQLTDGTPVPATIYGRVFWNDGSLKWCGFLVRPTTTIAGSGTLTLNVLSGGTAPAASSRALTDFTTENLQCQFDGLINLSGTWTSFLNNGISNTHQSYSGETPLVYGDGPVGKIWRVRASAEQSNSPQGNLEVYWYLYALQNAAGGLYGLRVLPQACQPWYDQSSGGNLKVFSALALKNGASSLLDPTAGNLGAPSARTFSSTGHGISDTTDTLSVASLSGFVVGFVAVLTTTGTLPPPLAPGTAYFVRDVGQEAGGFNLATANATASVVPITGAGSGVHTITLYPYISTLTGEYFRPTTAMYNYVQGSGSVAAEATVRVKISKTYWATTKLVPPWDTSITPMSVASVSSYWNGKTRWPDGIGQTGESEWIGLTPNNSAVHFLTQAAVDELNVRADGMISAMFPIWSRNSANLHMPSCNGTTYSGMTAEAYNGWIPPYNALTACDVMTGADNSHMPNGSWYAYVFTAEPHLLDTICFAGAWAVSQLYPVPGTAFATSTTAGLDGLRNTTISGVSYKGIINGYSQARTHAWGPRDVFAFACWGPSSPESSSYATYAQDLNQKSFDAQIAYKALCTAAGYTYPGTAIFNQIRQGDCEPYQLGYCGMSWAWGYCITQYANVLATLDELCAFWEYERVTFGGWNLGAFSAVSRPHATAGVDGSGAIVNKDTDMGENLIYVSWTSGGRFTFTGVDHADANYVLSNGDLQSVGAAGAGFPGGNEACYVVNATGSGIGSQYDLALTLGGTPLVTNTSGSTPINFMRRSANVNDNIYGSNGPQGFMVDVWAALVHAYAAGSAQVSAATISDMQTRVNYQGYYTTGFPAYPQRAYVNHF